MFGNIYGRFFLGPHLGLIKDDLPDTGTFSDLVETFPWWKEATRQMPEKNKNLYTMFETSDVHPDIIKEMKHFNKVIVPFPFLKNILTNNGINAESTNFYTSDLIRAKPPILNKKKNPDKLIFLYVGTNDIRKNTTSLVETFIKAFPGKHQLIVKTNTDKDLQKADNVKVITEKISLKQLASLYNLCDYVISFTRGEGVGLPMLEADYFNKPIITHDKGVFQDIMKVVKVPWIVLPANEVPIDYTHVPQFLEKVFYKSWWEIDNDKAINILHNIK